jgi:hypothetical protein
MQTDPTQLIKFERNDFTLLRLYLLNSLRKFYLKIRLGFHLWILQLWTLLQKQIAMLWL